MKLEQDSLDDSLQEALLEHLLGDQELPPETLQDPEVAARLDELEQVLAMAEQAPVPSRPDDYGTQVWKRLESQLPGPSESFSGSGDASRARNIRRFGQLAAAVFLVLVGFWAGRLQNPVSVVGENTVSKNTVSENTVAEAGQAGSDIDIDDEARERLLLAALGKHLGQTERLLTEVSNASFSPEASPNSTDGPSEQDWAEELLRTNRLYRQAAQRAGQTRIAALLAELEPIFLELAHAPADDELDDLKRRVDEKSLLFKVRITEGRLAKRRPSTI